jgi:large subunit ribosomal protein L32e
MVKFVRRTSSRYSKIGLRRKKKQVWRRPTGRDNKMREKRRGYPAVVSLGFRTEKKIRGQIGDKAPVMVKNIQDLEKVTKKDIAVLGKVGKKKKLEIAKKAKAKGIEFSNLNVKQLLKKAERSEKAKKPEKTETKKPEKKK